MQYDLRYGGWGTDMAYDMLYGCMGEAICNMIYNLGGGGAPYTIFDVTIAMMMPLRMTVTMITTTTMVMTMMMTIVMMMIMAAMAMVMLDDGFLYCGSQNSEVSMLRSIVTVSSLSTYVKQDASHHCGRKSTS